MEKILNEMMEHYLAQAEQCEREAEAARQRIAQKVNDADNDAYSVAEWLDAYTQDLKGWVARAREHRLMHKSLQVALELSRNA